MTEAEKEIFENPEREFTFEMASEIFHRQEYREPAMRGRQSANPLNKLGLSSARATGGPVRITRLGRALLEGTQSIESIFLVALTRLQFPSPGVRTFTEANGFNIRPLIATLQFLERMHVIYGQDGLTATEFSLFIPTLINHEMIDEWLGKLGEYVHQMTRRRLFGILPLNSMDTSHRKKKYRTSMNTATISCATSE